MKSKVFSKSKSPLIASSSSSDNGNDERRVAVDKDLMSTDFSFALKFDIKSEEQEPVE